jgi:hypothetical protein
MPSNISNGSVSLDSIDCFLKALLVVVVVSDLKFVSNSKEHDAFEKNDELIQSFVFQTTRPSKHLKNWTSHKLSDFTKTSGK